MGALQRDVYLRLSLAIFFTAYLFFVDVFIEKKSCDVDTESANYTREFNISQDFNSSTTEWANNGRNHINESLCRGANSFAHGQATYMTGLLIGSIFGGTLSDKYGKKFLLVCCCAAHALTAFLTAFLPYASFYLTARCITGITCCAIHICTYSLGVEWSLPKYRIWPPTFLSFVFSVGMMVLAAVAYFTHGWMQFHLALAIPQILCLPLYFSIPESPRWLLLNKKMYILESYRIRSPEDRQYLDLLLDTVGNERQKANTSTDHEKVSDFIHFKSATIIVRLFIMSFIGKSCSGDGSCFDGEAMRAGNHLCFFAIWHRAFPHYHKAEVCWPGQPVLPGGLHRQCCDGPQGRDFSGSHDLLQRRPHPGGGAMRVPPRDQWHPVTGHGAGL